MDWETLLLLFESLGEAALKLLQTPYLYVSLLLIALVYRRQIQLQRKLFFVRFHSFLREWFITLFAGLVAGIFATLALFAGDASIQLELVPVLWIVALALMFMRLRFVCFAFVIGLIGFAKPVLERFSDWPENVWVDTLVKPILAADMYSLFLLVGVLHFIEALLVRRQGVRMATPMFLMSKRGKVIGGYHLQRFWPVPLVMMVPLVDGATVWSILSNPEQFIQVLLLVPFPIIIGFSDMTITQLPQDKARSISNGLLMYSIVVIGLAVTVRYYPELTMIAAIAIILGHEALRWYGRSKENKLLPLYTNSSLGLKILAVLPGSPADKLGIQAGETIYKVNGVQVHSRMQMYEAMVRNSAYCKLEVFNHDGQLKFLNRAMFAGEHHQLGIVLAPDEDVKYYAEFKEYTLFTYLRWRLAGVLNRVDKSKR
jgi:hypothetical protein